MRAFKFSACDKQSRRKIVDDRQTGARLDPLTHKGGCRMFNEASGDPILPPDGQQKKRTEILCRGRLDFKRALIKGARARNVKLTWW